MGLSFILNYLTEDNHSCFCLHHSLEWVILPNYEAAEFQFWSVIATVLDSVSYCCVRLPCLPWYYSSHRSYHMSAFTHLGVSRTWPSILTSLSAYTTPWFPLHDSPPPVSSYSFLMPRLPKDAYLTPLDATMRTYCYLPPRIPSFLRTLLISAATLPTVLQLTAVSLCRSSLTVFLPLPQWFLPRLLPCPLCQPLRLINRDILKKTHVCPLCLLIHCRRNYPSIRTKE